MTILHSYMEKYFSLQPMNDQRNIIMLTSDKYM